MAAAAYNPLQPLQAFDQNADNPLNNSTPSLADAWGANANALSSWLAAQRADGIARGLIDPQTGWPTMNALTDAARQYGSALLGSTSAPGGRGFIAGSGASKRAPYQLNPYSAETLALPPNLTSAEIAAVNNYGSGSDQINLGNGQEVDELRKNLDSALGKSRLAHSTELYRGFILPLDYAASLKPGDVMQAGHGYVSTSIHKDVANNITDDLGVGEGSVLMTLKMPGGHPALHIPTTDHIENEFGNQAEVLLPRGLKVKLLSVREKADGMYEVRAEPVSAASSGATDQAATP
jgi:hypothetical protein